MAQPASQPANYTENLIKNQHVIDNLIIQGDNLDALKSLLPFYAGSVKCIFIDPPYNTGSAFSHYDDNLEHSLWLNMMYPRLELLHELLAEDGSIWITLDDNESHYCKVMCDEIFGRKNFVATCVWQKIHSTKNDAKYLSENHDCILVYAKNKVNISFNLLERTEEMDKRYKNPDNDPRGNWQSGDLVANEERINGYYDVVSPITGKVFNVPKGKHWVYSQENMEQMIRENRIWFGKDGNAFPRKKRFLSEVMSGKKGDTWWQSSEVGHNQEAKKEVITLFGLDNVFSTPKPERLIQRILQIATNAGDLVLDSFLGSGTTAAVAHKMNRRYIGIEIGEHAKTHVVPRLRQVIDGEQGGISTSNEVFALENEDLQELDLAVEDVKIFHQVLKKIGKETDLINQETLKSLQNASKTKKVKSESVWQGGGAFRFCELGVPVFDEYGSLNPEIKFADLAAYIWFLQTKTPFAFSDGMKSNTPLIGVHENTVYYLLYNGILGDKKPQNGNVLTRKILAELPELADFVAQGKTIVVYGEACRLGDEALRQNRMVFKQIPYHVTDK